MASSSTRSIAIFGERGRKDLIFVFGSLSYQQLKVDLSREGVGGKTETGVGDDLCPVL